MVERIEPSELDASALRFLEGLSSAKGGSVVPLPGREVYLFVSPAADSGEPARPWTDADAARRHELIGKELEGGISPEEVFELAVLDDRLDRHVQAVAPLPIEHARQVYREMKAKGKAKKKSQRDEVG